MRITNRFKIIKKQTKSMKVEKAQNSVKIYKKINICVSINRLNT